MQEESSKNTGQLFDVGTTLPRFLPTPRANESYQGDGAAKAYRDAGGKQPRTRNGKTRTGSNTFDTTLTTAVASGALTLSAAGSPARTSPWLAQVQGSTEPGLVFGGKCCESFANYDPDTSSWKTYQHCLFGGLATFSDPWPRAGSIVNGTASRRQPLAPLTGEIVSGSSLPTSLPTPTVMDSTLLCKGKAGANGHHSVQLSHLANSGALETENPIKTQDELRAKGALSKAERRQMWPTPHANCGTGAGRGPNKKSNSQGQGGGEFDKAVRKSTPNGGQLNPAWVEWLMGYPAGWTDLEDSATPLSPK